MAEVVSDSPIVLRYWGVRGVGEAIRTLLEYLQLPWIERSYTNPMDWFGADKDALATPFPNVPYILDGDFALAESTAILIYLCDKAKRPELARREDIREHARLNEVKGVVLDLRNEFIRLCYSPTFEDERAEVISKRFHPKLALFNKTLAEQDYIAGSLSFVDFILLELLSVIMLLDPSAVEKYENVKAYHARMLAIPQIAAYRASEKFMELSLIHI
eukprot:TRINITY_DN23261_c0_g1_i4.p1 TRINITY_DN23261_c0_g1~~TRINITY_DN23261_c0_g1_i4.p1  ORF type:complete len:217 (-),score=54.20 TRINITY_DN23261_c0_g1_i4:58-708(-)